MNKILDVSGKAYKLVCVIILVLMVLIVFTNTCMRYLFHSGIVQGEEILRYLFIWLSFLGIMAVYKERAHIAVTILTDRLSPRAAAIMSLLVAALSLFGFGVLFSGSLAYYGESGSTVGQLTGLPYRCIIAAILLAAGVCFLLTLRDAVIACKNIANPPAPEPKSDIPKSVREKLAEAEGGDK